MTHPTPGGFRGYYMLSVPCVSVLPCVTAALAAKRAARQCWPRSGQNGSEWRPRTTTHYHVRPRTTAHDHARWTAHDHARPPRTTTHDRARPRTTTHDHARPRTTTHDHARPRTTTHDHARPRTTAARLPHTTTHDHARPRTTTHDHARPRMTTHDHARPPRMTTLDHAWPRTTTHDRRARPRTTTYDHARPRTTTYDRITRPRTTTHNHARPPRRTTHDRARSRTTTHDRARSTTAAIFVWGSGTYPTPGGFWSFRGLNCLARLALARERTPSKFKIHENRIRDRPIIGTSGLIADVFHKQNKLQTCVTFLSEQLVNKTDKNGDIMFCNEDMWIFYIATQHEVTFWKRPIVLISAVES